MGNCGDAGATFLVVAACALMRRIRVSFVPGQIIGDKQGQGSEAGVVDDGLTVSAQQTAVTVQKIHEQEGAATFVAIGKGVILYDKI